MHPIRASRVCLRAGRAALLAWALAACGTPTATPFQPDPAATATLAPPQNRASPTSHPTSEVPSDWIAYTNTAYGYSLQYPPGLSIVKGPGEGLPDSAFQTVNNISFAGLQKPNDDNSGVVFQIVVDVEDASGNPLSCSDDAGCLNQFIAILGRTPSDVSPIQILVAGRPVQGFEYTHDNPPYSQTNRYFVFLHDGRVWQVGMTFNNPSSDDLLALTRLFDQVLSTFAFQE